jgi:hypothetical protein
MIDAIEERWWCARARKLSPRGVPNREKHTQTGHHFSCEPESIRTGTGEATADQCHSGSTLRTGRAEQGMVGKTEELWR